MAFFFKRIAESAHLAESKRLGDLRNTFVGIEKHILCLAYFKGYIIRMGGMLRICFKKVIEMRLTVSDMRSNIVDRKIFG